MYCRRGAEQEAALRQLLDEQQVKSSPNYHQWLTPEQFGKQFGPADADIQAVTDWLTTQGFQVNRVAAGRTVIEFSGTAGQVRQAFHTEIHKFVVNGEEHWANATRSPDSGRSGAGGGRPCFAEQLSQEADDSTAWAAFRGRKATGEVRPLFTFTDQERDLRMPLVRPISPPFTMSNRSGKRALMAPGRASRLWARPTSISRTSRDFRRMFGLPANDPQIILNGPDPGVVSTDEGEADLDVQWAGAVAKNATIQLVVSATHRVHRGNRSFRSLHY